MILMISVNRLSHARLLQTSVDTGVQSEPAIPDRPKLRVNKRITTDAVNCACAHLSSKYGITVATLRKAAQIVCKELYHHDVYLSSKEWEEQESQTENSHIYVVPSSRTTNEFKQIQALKMEKHAAIALYEKSEETKTTIYFDTIERSSIDGEWPLIIFKW